MKKAYDRMDGHTFEHYCAGLLRKNGFHHVEVTRGSGDQGIDILAWKHRKKYGIQCKCYSYYLGNKAIQEAYAGMKFYECDVAAVLTNQYFTNSAVALSEKTDVLLWNRSVLEELRKCKKPRLLNLAGLLGMVGSAWLFYFLCSAESLKAIRHLLRLTDCMFCAFLFLGSFLLFLEKGSFFLSLSCHIAAWKLPCDRFLSSWQHGRDRSGSAPALLFQSFPQSKAETPYTYPTTSA